MPATSQYSTPPNFPYFPPIAQIPVKPDFPLITSKYLQPNGYILTNNFYKWEFKKSRLMNFIDEIVDYFSENPPFTLENAKILVYNNYFIVFRTIILNKISNTNFYFVSMHILLFNFIKKNLIKIQTIIHHHHH